MNKDDENILQSLIAGGLIGATLGALLSNNKEDRVALGALAGAVMLATYKANERAQKSNLPVWVEENGKLYEILPGGGKRFIKNIPKPSMIYPEYLKLK